MIVLSEATTQRGATASARENQTATETARILGIPVHYIPEEIPHGFTAKDCLAYIPTQLDETTGIWIGFIPTPERYAEIYQAALSKGIRLVNTPEEHLRSQEFDRAYPFLTDLTPESRIITSATECRDVVSGLGLPLFVKGVIQSRKSRGWKACVAESVSEFERLTEALLSMEGRTRGRVVARKLVNLRHSQTSPEGFPFGREFRVFLYHHHILDLGYYWEGDDPLETLTPDENLQVRALAHDAASRLKVPFLAVDIGQLESGQWIVIEVGDGQFSGYSKIPVLRLWNQILINIGTDCEAGDLSSA